MRAAGISGLLFAELAWNWGRSLFFAPYLHGHCSKLERLGLFWGAAIELHFGCYCAYLDIANLGIETIFKVSKESSSQVGTTR